MSALFRIIYAAHANGTHHKLALDALNAMGRADAENWRRVFLKHIEKYLEGAKAPDNTFKDFKNHVLHVGDHYWGGAPEKVAEWYATTVTALRAEQWADAAYAAGVLSHYYTDPVMPFHTGQTAAENNVHRAVEWSINRSYDALRKLGEEKFASLDVAVPEGADWLKRMSLNGAEYSHRYYETLLTHYDLTRGVVAPQEGLDPTARMAVAELLIYAADGFGRILDRAVAESGVSAPEVALSLETIIATLKVPQKWLEKRLTNAADRKLVEAMYDELKATGRVETHLPEDDRVVRDLHAAEIAAGKNEQRAVVRAARVSSSDLPDTAAVPDAPPALTAFEVKPVSPPARGTFAKSVSAVQHATSHAHMQKSVSVATAPAPAPPPISAAAPSEAPKQSIHAISTSVTPSPAPVLTPPAPPSVVVQHPAPKPSSAEAPDAADAARIYLRLTDPLEAAPSIGPKMAQRFANLGIITVADFLSHDARDMAQLLDNKHFDQMTLEEWQAQARLVMSVPGLRGGHAQLLTGTGYLDAHAIALADPVAFCADILKFATSSDGKRILRDGAPPDIEKIKSWIEAARLAKAA